MARGLHIGASHLAALDSYVEAVEDAAYTAAAIATARVQQTVRERAERSIRWNPLGDHIHIASRDGYLTVGISDDYMSQAMDVEYGNEHEAPDPLLRTIGTSARGAAEEAQQYLQSKFFGAY